MEYQPTPGAATPEEIWKTLRAIAKRQERTSRHLDKLTKKEAQREQEAAQYRKEADEYRKQEAQYRKEEAQRKQEEAQRKQEEAQYRKEEARRKQEEAAQYRKEADEYRKQEAQYRKQEAQYREEEARRKQEADQRGKELDKRMKELQELFTGQWGKLMESLVEGDLLRLLGEKGIVVDDTTTRRKGQRNGRQFEFDIIASNGEEIVVVEVKTTLRVESVNEFLWEMERFTGWLPEYRDKRVYGAVAYLQVVEEAEKYAARKGLFVIRATGSSASIINTEDFRPRVFS